MARGWHAVSVVALCVWFSTVCNAGPHPGNPLGMGGHRPPHGLCDVQDHEKVRCGEPNAGVERCRAIDCCFDGRMCYYGMTVTVQCTRDGQFVLVVAREATEPELTRDSLSLSDRHGAACGPVAFTAAFTIFQFPVSACGTTMEERDGYLVYENKLSSSFEVGLGRRGYVTRESHFELLFRCRYIGTAVKALALAVDSVPPPGPVVVHGPLKVELRLANGPCATKTCKQEEAYASFYTLAEDPIMKVLQEPVFVEVHILERTDPNLVLMLGRCWTTSTSDPRSMPQWDHLVNGCPNKDDRYQTKLIPVDQSAGLLYPNHHQRFSIRMLIFVNPDLLFPLSETVYIHCSTAVCTPTASDSCEQLCGSRRGRAVAAVQEVSPKVVVSSPRVIFTY